MLKFVAIFKTTITFDGLAPTASKQRMTTKLLSHLRTHPNIDSQKILEPLSMSLAGCKTKGAWHLFCLRTFTLQGTQCQAKQAPHSFN